MSYDPAQQQVLLLTQSVALQQQLLESMNLIVQQLKVLNLLASDGFPSLGNLTDLERDIERMQ